VQEARDRISAAIKQSGYESPKKHNHKVVISLAPADTKKEGPIFDLPMALSYLLSKNEIAFDPSGILFLGELGLDGTLRGVKGALAAALAAKAHGFPTVVLPKANAREAALVEGVAVIGAETLIEVADHLTKKKPISPHPYTTPTLEASLAAVDLA